MPAKKKAPPRKSTALFIPEKIAPLVHVLRHEKVLLDSDLAELYGVTTGRLNEAVKRNLDRFPADFMFQPNEDEMEILILQIAISSSAPSNLRFHSGISKAHGGRATSITPSPNKESPCCPASSARPVPWR